MTHGISLLVSSLWLTAPAEPPDTVTGAARPAETLVPPEPLANTIIAPAASMAALDAPAHVMVRLRLDERGDVTRVELISADTADAALIRAVLEQATHFRFRPALHHGRPIPVDIEYRRTFLPAPTPLNASLEGELIQMGTRQPISGGRLVIQVGDTEYRTESDDDGRFALSLPAGRANVEVAATGYKRFSVVEELGDDERLTVRYLVERISYERYETVVIGKRERTEISRTSLRDREIKRVPGTFGDPFRVIATLPGVGQIAALILTPIVRGNSTSSTGPLLDGVRIPYLFHLIAGPAVIHPEFIDHIDFFPGAFSARYGGYIGGIVNGITRRSPPGEVRIDTDLNLFQAGAFVRGPIDALGVTATVAGRYGYPGYIYSLTNPDAFASYWDYQLRVDGGKPHNGWTAFALGAFDEVGDKEKGVRIVRGRMLFHRLDLRYRLVSGTSSNVFQLVTGIDEIVAPGPDDQEDNRTSGRIRTQRIIPRVILSRQVADSLRLSVGFEAQARHADPSPPRETLDIVPADWSYNGGVFVESLWQATDDLQLMPSIRSDIYTNERASKASVDPRLLSRYRLRRGEDGDTWLKGGVGWYHQPPRFFAPFPGLEEIALERGLLVSIQTSAGVELPLARSISLDVQTYFNYMDPIIVDLRKNAATLDFPGTPQQSDAAEDAELVARSLGRSYGFELMLRKRDTGRLFGWVAYTLSRSERRRKGTWGVFDFDRTHMVQIVAGTTLPRNWQIGGRFQISSGRPVTTLRGYNTARTQPLYRFDIRIDKRAVWNEWILDFYAEVINISLESDSTNDTPGDAFRFVLPTLGARAIF